MILILFWMLGLCYDLMIIIYIYIFLFIKWLPIKWQFIAINLDWGHFCCLNKTKVKYMYGGLQLHQDKSKCWGLGPS